MTNQPTPREEAHEMLRQCLFFKGNPVPYETALNLLTREVEKRRALEEALSEADAMHEGAMALAGNVERARHETEVATLREQLDAMQELRAEYDRVVKNWHQAREQLAAAQGECHHQHPMGPPGRIIQSHPATEPCLLREQTLRADLATALTEGARLRSVCERIVNEPLSHRHADDWAREALDTTPTTGAVLEAIRELDAAVADAMQDQDLVCTHIEGEAICTPCYDAAMAREKRMSDARNAPALRGLLGGE